VLVAKRSVFLKKHVKLLLKRFVSEKKQASLDTILGRAYPKDRSTFTPSYFANFAREVAVGDRANTQLAEKRASKSR
jgi:hypothetical protein